MKHDIHTKLINTQAK